MVGHSNRHGICSLWGRKEIIYKISEVSPQTEFWNFPPPLMAQQPLVGQGLHMIGASGSHPLWHTTISSTPLDEWSARRRDLYLQKQYSQERSIHATGGIWTHYPSKRMAADPRLRPRGRQDRRNVGNPRQKIVCNEGLKIVWWDIVETSSLVTDVSSCTCQGTELLIFASTDIGRTYLSRMGSHVSNSWIW